MQEICADQSFLCRVQGGVRFENIFNIGGARLKGRQQVSVTTFEVFEYVREKSRGSAGFKPKNSIDDMVGTSFVRWIEISGLSRGFEGPDNDPRRVGV